jgi:hypothetical protein
MLCTLPTTGVGHFALKSASPQVRKLFFVVPQHKLRFSKEQLRSLRFKLIDATFNRKFYEWIWYIKSFNSVVVMSFARKPEYPGLNPGKI